jgi:hypothetical protein
MAFEPEGGFDGLVRGHRLAQREEHPDRRDFVPMVERG